MSGEEPTGDKTEREKSAGEEKQSNQRSTMDSKYKTGRIESPLKKRVWKSKSRNNSRKKRKKTRSNKISDQRKRKFSVSKNGDELGATSNTSPFMKVPNNTQSKQFYSKNVRSRTRTEPKEEKSIRKMWEKRKSSRKKSRNKRDSSRKKSGKKKEAVETVQVALDGNSDLSSETVNWIIGDKSNEISQLYSNMGTDFGRKFVVLLKSVKFGFDMDYLTGIQAEFVVGNKMAVEAYVHRELKPEILKVEDSSTIKSNFGSLSVDKVRLSFFPNQFIFSSFLYFEINKFINSRITQRKLPSFKTRVASFGPK